MYGNIICLYAFRDFGGCTNSLCGISQRKHRKTLSLYQVFFFLNIRRAIMMESIRKKPRKSYRRFYTMLLKVSDALRYVVGTLDCITTWSRFVHHSLRLHWQWPRGLSPHGRRNRGGGQGGARPPTFQGDGRKEVPPPHFWARTYLKTPLLSPTQFHSTDS